MLRDVDRDEVRRIFSETRAIITNDHVVYAKKEDGWYHGSAYVNKDAIYPFVRHVKRLSQIIAMQFLRQEIEVVVGPAIGGAILAQWVAHSYEKLTGRSIPAVFADEMDGPRGPKTLRILKRGYDALVKGKACLLVEDVINTGNTVIQTSSAVLAAGGRIPCLAALCDRSGGKFYHQSLDLEFVSLMDLRMDMYKEEDCPICKEKGLKSVRTDLGKGREFLQRMGIS